MIGQTAPATENATATLKSDDRALEKDAAAATEAVQGIVLPEDVLPPKEFGGRDGPEPTRYGDWEKNGRCIDF